MNLKLSFYVSILLYAFAIFFLVILSSNKQEELNPIELQKGATGFISFVFSYPTEGIKQNAITKEISSVEGTIAEEIHKIQNKISYPAQALEDELESECEWSVVINAKQKASQIKTLRPCRYKIFEEEFHRVIQDWNFNLPEKTVLQIPVSFKIKNE